MSTAIAPVADDSVWHGCDLADKTDWIDAFDGREIDALMTAPHVVRKNVVLSEFNSIYGWLSRYR